MYIVLLCLQRNLNLLDLQLEHEQFKGFVFVNDQSYGQGMNAPDFRGTGKFSWGRAFVNF